MDSKRVSRVPTGRLAAGILFGLIVGALLPFIAVLQISLLVPVLMLGGIFTVYLKSRAGWIPAGVLIAVQLISTTYFLGGQIAIMLFACGVLPALIVLRRMEGKPPFFAQLRTGVIAFAAGLLAAMIVAYASFGGGMVVRFVDILRTEYRQMPDAALQPLVDSINSMLAINGAGGARGLQLMTVDAFRAQLTGVLDLLQQTYAEVLPGTLLSGAVLSGVLSVLWGNWIMARQGKATNESFIGLSRWFLPGQITFGAVALWLLGLALAYGGYSAGSTVYSTICQLAGAVFFVQAMAALDRRMLGSGRSLTRRRMAIVLFSVISLLLRGVGSMLCYIGAASALFGSRGAVRLWVQKRQNDESDRHDPDE